VRPRAARIRRGSGGARKLVELDGEPGELAERLVAAMESAVAGEAGTP
jgi:hypothetical protein